MKLLVIPFILKLYAQISIFKYIQEKYGQEMIKLARKIEKRRVKIAKIKCHIKFILYCKKNNLAPIFTTSKFAINPIQDGLFQGCSRMVGGQKCHPFLKCVTHILNDKTWRRYTLPKEDPKNIWITSRTPWVLLTSAFFQWKSANFVI